MPKPGAAYPQVEPGAAALMDRRVAACPAGRRVGSALDVARRAGAETLTVGARGAVRRRELERVSGWGLGRLRAGEVGWSGLAAVAAGAAEVRVRRLLMDGAPMVLVRERRRVVGVIDAETVPIARPALSLTPRLDLLESRSGEARLWLLRAAGKLGESRDTPIFAVGGFVRDLLLGGAGPDVDLVVEGDGVAFARLLHEEIGGRLVIHRGFATASIEGAAGPDGSVLGRIDIASARRERYEAPGALPVVSGATMDEDLRRRDFSVNAMALLLQPSSFGRLLDPLGGQLDLRRRRLRPLHPLSFVEDPTRIFRAARYACRLGFRLDRAGMRALKLALRVGDYPALSGQRLRAEIDLLASEPRGWRGLELLLKWDVLRLWDSQRKRSRASPERVKAARRLSGLTRRAGIALDASELALLVLLVDQPARVRIRCLERLAVSGEPLARLSAGAAAAPLARRLDRMARPRPSKVAEALFALPIQVLAGAYLRGGTRARRLIEWFLDRGRRVRPHLSGEDIVALGVPRGREVGECLSALRRLRLDGVVRTRSQERAFVRTTVAGQATARPRLGSPGGRERGSRPPSRASAARTTRREKGGLT